MTDAEPRGWPADWQCEPAAESCLRISQDCGRDGMASRRQRGAGPEEIVTVMYPVVIVRRGHAGGLEGARARSHGVMLLY